MVADFWWHTGTSQSNEVGTASSKAAGGTGQDANGSDAGRFADIAACTYWQLSADTPATPGGAAQAYNTNVGPIAMKPYAASGNDISSAYAVVYLGIKHGAFATPAYTAHAVGSTTLVPYWGKGNVPATSLYADEVSFINARFADIGRPMDVYDVGLGESDANNPTAIAALASQWNTHFANLMADCPGAFTANTLICFNLINPNANLPGDGDVASMRAAQIAYVAANASRMIGVDPYLIPVAADPHYRADGYWSRGAKKLRAVASIKFPALKFDRGPGPTPYVQADGPIATTQNNTTTLKPRGEVGRVGERAGRDVQVCAVATYTQATTHTMEIGAGPAGGSGSGGTGADGGFLAIGAQVDSISTNHHALSAWWRTVVDTAMSSDAFGVRHMPTPSIRCASSTLNSGQILTIGGTHPTSPIAGSYDGTNDGFTTGLNIPKVAPGTPIQVPAGALAVAIIGTNGASQAVTAITNPDTGPWTIHRNQIVNPGSGSVGITFASAVCNGGQLRQTTATLAVTGLNVGKVIVFAPLNTGDATATIVAPTATASGSLVDGATATATVTRATATSAGILVATAATVATSQAPQATATGFVPVIAAITAIVNAPLAASAGFGLIVGTGLVSLPAIAGFAEGEIVLSQIGLYCTIADLVNAIGADNLRQLSDLDNRGIVDNNRVIAAIQVGDGIINSYVGKRYAVPLAAVPQTINTLSIKWALRTLRERAFKVQPLQEDIEADKVDREWLLGIAQGQISIGVDVRPPHASDRIDVGAAPRESSRAMSLRRMKGFI